MMYSVVWVELFQTFKKLILMLLGLRLKNLYVQSVLQSGGVVHYGSWEMRV